MQKLFLAFICVFSSLFSNELLIEQPENDSNIICNLRQNVLEKGVKIINAKTDFKPEEVSTNELIIDLKNPSFSNGILITEEGGVIKNKDFRIQAKSIQYTKKNEKGKLIHKIEAEGNLMMIYGNRVFIGDELEYDFVNKTGVIYNGKTYTSPWYIGGDKILLKSNGTYNVENVFITTCENADSAWDIKANNVSVENKDLMKAKKIRFRLFKLPALWLPSFKINLKKFFKKPIITYKINWDKASGPRASVRYQAYSWNDLAVFLRLDYRLKMGIGGALETEYLPADKNCSFITRSYATTDDITTTDLTKKKRFRLQGSYKGTTKDNKTTGFLTWDRYRDIDMPGDFKSDDFEVDTAKKTEFSCKHQTNDVLALVHSRVKVNNFETIKQDLPTLYANVHPIKFEKTGIISLNQIELSYLDYSYAKDIKSKQIIKETTTKKTSTKLHGLKKLLKPFKKKKSSSKQTIIKQTTFSEGLKDFHSFRSELNSELYRPFNLKTFIFTPKVGFAGVFYGNSPENAAKILGSFLYEGKLQTTLFRNFKNQKHLITPYIKYQGITKPSVSPDNHYIFSLQDGFDSINMIKLGVLTQLFPLKKNKGLPSLEVDISTNCFLGSHKTSLTAPKSYLSLTCNLPSLFLHSHNAWDFNKKNLDFSNTRLGYTMSENTAFALEYRYRSHYAWRKSDYENFILDVSRHENELLSSPLSDKRQTFLSHVFIRLTPSWCLHLQSHTGWGRKNNKNSENGYNEYTIDLYTLLSTSWKIKLSYLHTQNDDRFTFDYYLLKF